MIYNLKNGEHMKAKIGLVLLVSLLVTAVAGVGATAQADETYTREIIQTPDKTEIRDAKPIDFYEIVPKDIAKRLAEYQLEYLVKMSGSINYTDKWPFKAWENANIGYAEEKYTPDGTLTAYDFKVVKDGKIVGQILVNARKAGVPIVEFSTNENVSFGKTNYLPLFDASKRYLNSHNVPGETIVEKRRNLWEKSVILLKGRANKDASDHITPLASTPVVKGNLLFVDHIAWDDGCSPTSAAMILEYHGEHGYPNLDLPDWWYTEPTDVSGTNFDNPPNEHMDLTEELHIAMGTTDDGTTWPGNFDDGIEAVASNHGYNFDAVNVYGADYFGEYIPEIDAARPVMISAPPYGFPGYSLGHSVVGVGYQYTTDGIVTWDEYYIVNDPNHNQYQWWSLGAVNMEMYTKVIP